MPVTYLPDAGDSWWTEVSDNLFPPDPDTLPNKDFFLSQLRTLVVDHLSLAYNFEEGVVPIGEGWEYNGEYWQPVMVGRDIEDVINLNDDLIDMWTMDLQLARFSLVDLTFNGLLDITAVEPTIRDPQFRRFRECMPANAGSLAHPLSQAANFNPVTSFAVSEWERFGDGLRGPGRMALAHLADAQADIYAVHRVGDYAVPALTHANQLWVIDLRDGSRPWDRKGFSTYPINLAAYDPNMDHQTYPWGNQFGNNGINFTQTTYTVLGPFGEDKILVYIEEQDKYPQIRSDFEGYFYNRPFSFTNGAEPNIIRTNWGSRWTFRAAHPASLPNGGSPQELADWMHWGVGDPSSSPIFCGEIKGNPLRKWDASGPSIAPVFEGSYESAQEATNLFSVNMAEEFAEVAAIPLFEGSFTFGGSKRWEVIRVSDGTTLASFSSSGTYNTGAENINGPSELDLIIGSGFDDWGLYNLEDFPDYYKPGPFVTPGFVGGQDEGDVPSRSWGQLAYGIQFFPDVEDANGQNPKDLWVPTMKEGSCSVNINVPNGIYMESSDPQWQGHVAHILARVRAPKAGGESSQEGNQNFPLPASHSETQYCYSGNRIIFLTRPKTPELRYWSPEFPFKNITRLLGGFDQPDGGASTRQSWNAQVNRVHTMTAIDFDEQAGTLTKAWELNTAELAGWVVRTFGAVPAPPAYHQENGDCVSNALVTEQFLYVVIKGGWGESDFIFSYRVVQIRIFDLKDDQGQVLEAAGTVVSTTKIDQPTNPLELEIADTLIAHNRRPVILVKPASQPETFALELKNS